MTTTEQRLTEVTTDLMKLAADASARFDRLSGEQLNWRPAPDRWSVAQCLEHLITIQSLYQPLLRRLAEADYSPTWWERYSPLSRLFGSLLVNSLSPDNLRKTKTSARAEPSSSAIADDVIERFGEHQRQLVELLRTLPSTLDLATTTVTSPLSAFVTYSLDDCLTILVVHGQRHFKQAQRVIDAEGFPL